MPGGKRRGAFGSRSRMLRGFDGRPEGASKGFQSDLEQLCGLTRRKTRLRSAMNRTVRSRFRV